MLRKQIKTRLILWCFLTLPLTFAASLLITSHTLAVAAGVIASIPVSFAARRFLVGRSEQSKLKQFQSLLAFLASRVASGQTLEHALIEAGPALQVELGPKNSLVHALTRLKHQLQAQMQTDAALAGLANYFSLARITAQLSVLAPLNRHGGRLDIFLRRSHDALNKERRMQANVAADRSQTTSETFVLLVLPFVLAASMSDSYQEELAHVSWQAGGGLLVFALAILAIVITLIILSPKRQKKTKNSIKPAKKKTRQARLWRHIYLQLLPGDIGYRLQRAASHIGDDGTYFTKHLQDKSPVCLFAVFFTAFLWSSGFLSVFAIPLALLLPFILHDLDLLQSEAKRVQSYRLELPVVLNLLVILLESGLTLDTALTYIPLTQGPSEHFSFNQAMRRAKQKLALGQSSDQVLSELADACPIQDLASALHLTARYARQGGAEIISLLAATADDSWQEYRLALQGKLERRTLLLMIPMGLDLVAVILVAVLPAIASLSMF